MSPDLHRIQKRCLPFPEGISCFLSHFGLSASEDSALLTTACSFHNIG